jgi:hypothetical protein
MNCGSRWKGHVCLLGALGAGLSVYATIFFSARTVSAVPSFARQTGLTCNRCHINPAELTDEGRKFKLNGYTTRDTKGLRPISTPPDRQKSGLDLLAYLPLSAWFEISNTGLHKPQPGTQNWNFSLPQDVSLFLAGAFSTHSGGFIQATYDVQADHFSLDNTDIRYARSRLIHGKPLVYGITLNNNPTIEDIWNSTPAWGYPWIGPVGVPTPSAGAIVDGALGQDVAGVGGYAMYHDHLYGAATVYRSAHLGVQLPNAGTASQFNIQGAAPYWRVAWQQGSGNNYLEVGTYGMHMASTPLAIMGLRDTFTDVAADYQYERVVPQMANDIITFHGTYIHESSNFRATFNSGGASMVPHHLNTFRTDLVYHWGFRLAPAIGYFVTSGTSDPLLYPAQPLSGSLSGSPHSQGIIANVTYWPVMNIRLAAQYTRYFSFNGSGTNYDGSGRNAGDNNSVYLLLGIVF